MKIVGKRNDPSQSCSCTSCVYHSGSDNVSLHKLLLKGSRIDRLYYGKYIPLRERKLLDKLVRTRAVYDDIRAQLVSESASSLQKNADFKPKSSASEVDDTEKSSAILELVNLVDKGKALKSSKLSECCSCCSCSSKLHSGEHTHNVHKHRHAHGSRYAAEQRRHEFKKKKGVRFKAKHIKSDPCTCTYQFSGLDKKNHDVTDQAKLKEKIKESATNLKNKMVVGMQKIHDSKTRLQEAIADHTQDSIEKLMRIKDEIKSVKRSPDIATYENEMWIPEEKTKTQRIRDLATESLEKIKTSQTRLKNKLQESGEKIDIKIKKSLEKIKKGHNKIKKIICKCPESVDVAPGEKAIALKIRKDSIRKFKENLSRKHNLKDWTCEDDCIEGTCVPEQCYEILKLRKANKQKVIDTGGGTEVSGRQNTGIQPQKTNIEIATQSKKHRKVKQVNKMTEENGTTKKIHNVRSTTSSITSETGMQNHTTNLQKVTKRGGEGRKEKRTHYKKGKQTFSSSEPDTDANVVEEHTDLEIAPKRKKNLKAKKVIEAKTERRSRKEKARQTLSSSEQDTDAYMQEDNTDVEAPTKIKKDLKSKRGDKVKKEKVTHKQNRSRKRKDRQTRSSTELETDDNVQEDNSDLQIPTKPNKNLKAKDKKATRKKKGRSPSASLSSGQTSTRQAVRVGSSFSFNIEFYKDKPNVQLQESYPKKKTEFEQSSVIQISRPKKDNKKRDLERPQKQSKVEFKKSKKDLKKKGIALKRCFCTLKLKAKKRKSLTQKSVGTMSSFRSFEAQKGRKKKDVTELLPYECEPGICVPDQCNPNICLQIINKRLAAQKQIRTKHSHTSTRRTRSTSSVTPQLKSSKAKEVQSAIMPRRVQAQKKDKVKTYRVQRPLVAKPNRNVVRIGSSFSFNIDFFKDTGQKLQPPPSKHTQPYVHSLSIQPKIKQKPAKTTKKVKDKQKKQKNKHVCTCTSSETEKSTKKTRSQATKTEKNVPYFSHLEPYECEPFTCIPGECDPYICLEKIKKRNKNTKEVSLGTYPESRSTSSYTYSHKSKDGFAQSKPHTKKRKVLAKTKVARPKSIKKENIKHQDMKPQSHANKLKSAVSVGSTFSFNIEFSKNYSRSDNTEVTPPPPPIPINVKTKQKVTHKGIKINKTNVDNANTQVKVKKADKSSIVGPMLKRCFCTLNLYKKQKRDKKAVYAVNTAFIENTLPSSIVLDSNKRKNLYKHIYIESDKYSDSQQSFISKSSNRSFYKEIAYKRSAIHINPLYACYKTRQSLEINSDLSINVELVKKSSHSKLYLNKTQLLEEILIKKYNHFLRLENDYSKSKGNNITGFSNYLNKCFCAMNMQIENSPKRKLKPYECEPGVCIPGQCNPYECQKLILKRLQKGYSKSSATDTGSQSVTSSQTQKSPTQSDLTNTYIPEHKEKQNIRSVRKPGGNQKQMVRVGSSFSFDVEFFKNRSYSTDTSKQYEVEQYEPPKSTVSKRTKKQRSIKQPSTKTKERKIVTKHDTRDSDTQSERQKVKDKTSHTIQKMQRCFCTLKLQKKGKIKPKLKSNSTKSIAKSNKIPTDTSQDEAISVKTVNKGQNTKHKAKSLKATRELLPYECEPGICIPGECDPYECLALINKRKLQEKGTDTPVSKKRTASNTMDAKKKRKSRAVFVQPKPQPVIRAEKPKEYVVKAPQKNTKQAVRIGSSFSFNIDFYKTNVPSNKLDTTVKAIKSRTSQKSKKEHKKVEKQKPKKSIKIVTPSNANTKVSQTVKLPTTTKSTAVEPFLKRCFCTLQLRNKDKKASKEKKISKEKTHHVIKPEYKSATTMTSKKSKKRSSEKRRTKYNAESHELLPYECEPSFCTPGECDPIVCLERIKKRNVKSFGTEVVSKKKKDIGSIATLKKNKHKKTQSERIDVEPPPKVEYKQVTPKMENRVGQKQMVRIGSNFSFNIEFFKDSGDHHPKVVYDNYEKPAKKITEHTIPKPLPKPVPKSLSKSVSKKQKSIEEKKSVHSRQSQTQKKSKSTKSGGFINLKRCFCTLSLKNNNKVTTKKRSKDKIIYPTPIEEKKSKSKKQIDEKNIQSKIQAKDKKSKSKIQAIGKKSKSKIQAIEKKSKSKFASDKKVKEKSIMKKDKKNKKGSIHKGAQATKSAVSVVSTFFRKCLCVLKLNTKGQSEIKPVVNVQIKPQKLRSSKLEPYECEPGVCIPDECDPYECDKLIKKRLLQENATETKSIKYNTKSIVTPSAKSHKSKKVEAKPVEASAHKSRHDKTKPAETSSHKSKRVKIKPTKTSIKEVPTKIRKPSPSPDSSDDTDTTNRQSVKIGSSFSFDIEFFKNRSSEQSEQVVKPLPKSKEIDTKSNVSKKRKKEKKYNSTKQQSWQNVSKYDASQSTNVKTQPSSTITDPLLKRCFCTLQLHKSAARVKSSHKSKRKPLQTPMQNKRTSTKKATTVSYMTSPHEYPPFMCMPNQCNPKECDEKIKNMKFKAGDQTMNGKHKSISHKSVTTKPQSTKSKKIQTKVFYDVPPNVNNEHNGIVEVPRFNNFLNKEIKQAVRYGSNFSFNIEFYREVLPPLSLPPTNDNKKKTKNIEACEPLNCLRNQNKIRSSSKAKSTAQSQINRNKTQSKRSMAANKLKQCFCSLKLQKSKSECKTLFPQKIEVRRVEIQNNIKKPSKKTNTEAKTVSTKIDNKLIQPNTARASTPQKNADKMTTILPYKPNKFNKNASKTSLIENKQKNKKERITKPSLNVTNYGKRLTRKKSLNEIYCTKLSGIDKSNNSSLKQYLCRCADNVFCQTGKPGKSRSPEKYTDGMIKEGIKLKLPPKGHFFNKITNNKHGSSKDQKGPKKDNVNCLCKASRSNKLSIKDIFKGKKECLCKKDNECLCRKSVKLSTKKDKNCLCPRRSGDFWLLSDALATLKKCHLKIMSLEDENRYYVCPKCLEMHKPTEEKKKEVNFKDIPSIFEKITLQEPQQKPKSSKKGEKKKIKTKKKKIKTKKKSKNFCETCARPIDEKCQYCKVCFKSPSILNTYYNVLKQQLEKAIKTFLKPKVEKEIKPLFDVLLESESHCMINKEEVTHKVKELYKKSNPDRKKKSKKSKDKKHSESCQCCVCLKNKSGKRKKGIKKGAKQIVDATNKIGAIAKDKSIFRSNFSYLSAPNRIKKNVIEKRKLGKCTCGSGVCAHNVIELKQKMKAEERKKQYKPCVCGSDVCTKESTLMRDITKGKKVTCTCKEIMDERRKKAKIKADKEYKKRRKVLDKEEEMEDLTRKKFRIKQNKRLNKSLKKTRNASDASLVADSVVDVARFSLAGISDLFRAIFRCARDPRRTANRLRAMRDDPTLIGKTFVNALSDTGVASTAQRIGKRVGSMESVKSATRYLEQYQVSNYLLHINDPKKRLNPRKMPRRKERIDFHCNLFMSSLRRRPHLWIYDRWPWFYPHCLTFLNIWRQFADLLLFLLAVVVWSPCIFAMEMCRAVMCCTFCTG